MRLSRNVARYLPLFPRAKRRLLRRISDREYQERLAIARRANDRDKIEQLELEKQFWDFEEYEEEEIKYTRKLMTRANELRVEIPSRPSTGEADSEHWSYSSSSDAWYLTQPGGALLRERIRAEEKARREGRSHWLAWGALIVGLVSAVSAFWKNLKG